MSEPARLTLDGKHQVLTPEYVQFDFLLAGLYSRFLAWLIDSVIALMMFLVLIFILSFTAAAAAFAGDGLAGFAAAFLFIAWFLVDWGYAIFFEVLWSGQTIGKRVLGLRVIQESGVRVGFLQSALRNLARPVDRLPVLYLVGAACAVLTRSQQRLGDLVAGTIVIKEPRLVLPASLSRPEGDTALLDDPDFRARVARLSPQEEALLLACALRREELGIEARLSLFATLSTRLQDDAGFFKPPHLSDEKLVLLVTAALAARKSAQRAAARPRQKL